MQKQKFIETDEEKLSGTPVFVGTCVPVKNPFDSLEEGESLDEFLDQYPTVTRQQVIGVLEASKETSLANSEMAR